MPALLLITDGPSFVDGITVADSARSTLDPEQVTDWNDATSSTLSDQLTMDESCRTSITVTPVKMPGGRTAVGPQPDPPLPLEFRY